MLAASELLLLPLPMPPLPVVCDDEALEYAGRVDELGLPLLPPVNEDTYELPPVPAWLASLLRLATKSDSRRLSRAD